MACTVLHMGHLLEWSVVRAKQARQKVWPHGVVTGSKSSFMHSMHSVSSHLSTVLADLKPQTPSTSDLESIKMVGCSVHTYP